MNSTHIKSTLFSLGILGISIYQINGNSSGASSPKTGAPGENTCTSCHSGSSLVTSGTQHTRIRLIGNFTGNGYIPDSTYTLTLTYAESGKSTFGFQMTSLANSKAAGTFTASTRTGTFSSNVNGSARYYVEHNSTGSSSIAKDSTAWTFQWKAPSSNVGEITFYAALNATNGNGSSNGDVIYNKTFKIQASSLLPEATPKLKSSSICAGALAEFEGSGTNNSNGYAWTFPTGTPSTSSLQNPSIRFSSAGTHLAILSVSNNKGKSQPDTIKFTVLDAAIKPNLNIRTPTAILCLGDTLNFSIGTTQKHTYTWSNGSTGRNNPVDTTGFVFVTAVRDNGCSVTSDSVFVAGIPKPTFTVKYGIPNDSICVNENLLILLQNNGFADSYSRVSAIGPYFRDSFLINSIQKGNNSFKFWAKSKIGCVSGPSNTKVFYGIDTPSAPVVKVLTRLSDKILFTWDSVLYSKYYEFSLDKGKSWKKTDSAISVRNQWVQLDSATQLVDFWLRAQTGDFCTYSHIGKIQARGAGCNEPNWNITFSDSIVCTDSIMDINVSGLSRIPKYHFKVNGTTVTDTALTEIIRRNSNFKFELLDSSQLLCGYFEKNIRVLADTPRQIINSYSPNNTTVVCGGDENTKIPITISNFRSDYIYYANIMGSITILDSSNAIDAKLGENVWALSGETPNGCPLPLDTVRIYVDKAINTSFTSKWISDFNYQFTAALNDTDNYNHYWIDSVTNTPLTNQNQFEITIDYSSQGEGDAFITHTVIPKTSDTLFDLSICNYELTQKVEIRNLGIGETPNNTNVLLYPNPLASLDNLKCINCKPQDLFILQSISGEIYGKFQLSELKKQTLASGVYLITIESGGVHSTQRIHISR